MKMSHLRRGAACLAAAAAVVSAADVAHAAACSTYPSPIYIAGSSAVKPVLAQIAKIVGATGANPQVTIVYESLGSCAGLDAITNGTKVTATPVIWDPANNFTAGTCDLPVGGVSADVGVSDVFPTTCPNITVPSGMADFQGPVQVMNFVAPLASNQSSISSEAAFAVLGWVGSGMYSVAPWTDLNSIFIRPDTSGTKQMIATAIGLPAAKWKGTTKAGSSDVLAAVKAATTPNATFGILASDLADANRDSIKVLAFQAKNQMCGYLPDSSSTSFDKVNVREGRYDIWGPVHFVTAVDGQGKPSNANVAAVMNRITRTGITDADKKAMIDAEAAAHTVPQCAMHVKRTKEVDTQASYQPDEPCGCYFESKAGSGASASCKTCTTDSDCSGGTPKCRYGYCEVK